MSGLKNLDVFGMFGDSSRERNGGLLPESIKEKLRKFPIGSQQRKGMDSEVIVKFYNPTGAGTWLITEGEQWDNGDWELFGYCCIFDWEWGSVMLSELENMVVIQRDQSIGSSAKVRDLVK